MKKFLLLFLILVFFPNIVFAAVRIENIDTNAIINYTVSDIRIDVNVFADENKNIILQFFDNNVLRDSKVSNIIVMDGNINYFYNFVFQFTQGVHIIDINIVDSNYNSLDSKSKTIDVLASPLPGSPDISWELIQQYVLPIARSLSSCLVEKADLNVIYIQSQATMKSLENDVSISQADKQAAEDSLAIKKVELDSSNSARAVCEADKVVVEGKFLNSQMECDNKMNTQKNDKDAECTRVLGLKDDSIAQRDYTILAITQNKLEIDAVATAAIIGICAVISIIGFLYYKGRILV